MASYDSSIGKKNFTNQQPMREFEVPDESGYQQSVNPVYKNQQSQQPNFQQSIGRTYSTDPNQFNLNLPPDPKESEIAQAEQEFRRAREERKSGKERLNEGAKKRLDILLGMTRLIREVDIEGNVFVLQTLKSKETSEAILKTAEVNGIQSPFEARRQFLSYSLKSIAGVDFDQFIGSNVFEDKLAFIDEMDDALLNRLYNEYMILRKESQDKYEVKTEVDVKEVVEDLKKL